MPNEPVVHHTREASNLHKGEWSDVGLWGGESRQPIAHEVPRRQTWPGYASAATFAASSRARQDLQGGLSKSDHDEYRQFFP